MCRLILLMTLLCTGCWGWFHHNHEGRGLDDWHSDCNCGGHGWHGHHGGHGNHGWHGNHGSQGHGNCQHGNGDNETFDHKFDKLSSCVIKTDKCAKKLCELRGSLQVQEIYGASSYMLVYTVPESHDDNITVKIKHRVLYINGKAVGNSQAFNDVRILPNSLKTVDAYWQYKDNLVTVEIPYDTTTMAKLECSNINEEIITVAKAPGIIYKFGESQQF